MALSDPWDNTAPTAITPGQAAPFDNTGPTAGSPGQADPFDNGAPTPGTPGQATPFDNTGPQLNKTPPTKMYPAKAAGAVNVNLGTWTTAVALDTITVVEGDSVLLRNQTAPAENGLYVVAGNALRRHPDFDTSEDFNFAVCLVVVAQGATQTGPWMLTTPGPIVLGTTGLNFGSLTGYGRQFQNDDQPEGRDMAKSVIGASAATTANVNLAVTMDGVVIDGYGLSAGVIFLVKDQTNPVQNGVYLCNVTPNVATRYQSADHQSEFEGGQEVVITFGDTQTGKTFVLTTPSPIFLGTTPLNYADKAVVAKTTTAAFDNTGPTAGTPGNATPFDNTGPTAGTPGQATPFDNTVPTAGSPGQATPFDNAAPVAGGLAVPLINCAAVVETNWNLATTLDGFTQDGYGVGVGEFVLLNGQTDPRQNGIYEVQAGAPTRHTGYNTSAEFTKELFGVLITEGNRGGDVFYWQYNTQFTLGVSNVVFTQDKAVPKTV